MGQHLGLVLVHPASESCSRAQRLGGVHSDVYFHPPLHCLQEDLLLCGYIQSHQPSGEALVAFDPRKQRHIALAHRYGPCYARVEVIVHADSEA